jgi:hypothetical protein
MALVSKTPISTRLFWGVLIVLGMSIGLAILALSSLAKNVELQPSYSFALFASIFLQVIVVILSAEAWLFSLSLKSTRRYTLNTFVISGLFNICKYIPGKVWGIAIRGVLIKNHSSESIEIKNTLTDQVAMIHSGFSLLTLVLSIEFSMAFLAVPLILLSIVSISPILRITNNWLTLSKTRLFRKIGNHFPSGIQNYPSLYLRYVIIWLVLALSLGCCIYSVESLILAEPMLVLKLTMFGYFAGFLAFFLPSGIGARDGVFYFMLLNFLTPSEAVTVTVLHRIVVTSVDIVLALPAIPMLRVITSSHDSI